MGGHTNGIGVDQRTSRFIENASELHLANRLLEFKDNADDLLRERPSFYRRVRFYPEGQEQA
jgi:hypothetical protein